MKSAYIAIAMVAMIAAVVLLSGCTSGPAMNTTKVTVTPIIAPTVATIPMTGTDVGVDAANMTGTATVWPDIRSGNNTSIINTSSGMKEVPNSMLAGNTTKKDTEVDAASTDAAGQTTDTSAQTTDTTGQTTDAAVSETTDAGVSNQTGAMGNQTGAMASPTAMP